MCQNSFLVSLAANKKVVYLFKLQNMSEAQNVFVEIVNVFVLNGLRGKAEIKNGAGTNFSSAWLLTGSRRRLLP